MAEHFLKNPGFELGDQNWDKGTGYTILSSVSDALTGIWVGRFTGSADAALRSAANPAVGFPVRPGGKITASVFIDSTGASAGASADRLSWRDKDGVQLTTPVGTNVPFGGSGYVQSVLTDNVAPDRAKSVSVETLIQTSPVGTWFIDDFVATGSIIESIPTTAKIQSHSMFLARTIAAFDPLIGATKFSDFNAGMSDKWAGVFTFIPLHPTDDLGELLSFLERVGQIDRFFAFDPDRRVPKNGVVNGMLVDGAGQSGTLLRVKNGPVSSTALVAGDYVEVRDQFFQLVRDLEIGPEQTGEMHVKPAIRTSPADGEDVITNNPKMVARFSSEPPRRSDHTKWTQLSMSWEEV